MTQLPKRDREMWNPTQSVEVTPEEYEKQVLRWLGQLAGGARIHEISHLKTAHGVGGDYTLDGYVELEIFGGAKIAILIECKRHRRPVERETVLGVHARLQDVAANKAMIFSTAGFQKGAVDYATGKGIALVTFIDGRATYETKGVSVPDDHSYPPSLPRFAGQLVSNFGSVTRIQTVIDGSCDALSSWLIMPADEVGN